MMTVRLLSGLPRPGLFKAGAVLGLVLGLGCSGSGSKSADASSTTAPTSGLLAQGSYTLAVTLPTATLPVSALDLTLTLPPGVSVATFGTEGQISGSALRAGSDVLGSSMVTGTYLTAPNQARLSLVAAPGTAWSGQALVLVVTVATPVAAALFQSLNAPLPACAVVGLDAVNHNTVLLTGQMTPTLAVLGVASN